MKSVLLRCFALLALGMLGVVAFWWGRPEGLDSRVGEGRVEAPSWEPEEVFRRAFWRHPTASDRILHAERFEPKSDDGGAEYWQWFIALQPGPELLGWLRNPDSFALIPADDKFVVPDWVTAESRVPDWFPGDDELEGVEVLMSPAESLLFLYRERDNTLFGVGFGHGFAPPVRE